MTHRAIAALAAALLLLTPAPAHAESPWTTRQPCATGDIASRWPGEDDQGRATTWLAGWIKPCRPAVATERFGFIYYVRDGEAPGPRGYVFHDRLRPYTAGRTTFAGTIDPSVEQNNGTLIAVCLAHGPGKLIDCAQPFTDDCPPLPPIRDLAALPMEPGDPVGTEPNCATCV